MATRINSKSGRVRKPAKPGMCQAAAKEHRPGPDFPERLVLDLLNEGVVTLRQDKILYCNPRFAEMVGQPVKAILGCGFSQFVAHSDGLRLLSFLRACRCGPGKTEVALKDANGRSCPVLLSANCCPGSTGAELCLVLTDLSAIKPTDASQPSHEPGVQLVPHAPPTALWDWDRVTDTFWYSEGFRSLFGYLPDEMRPDFAWWVGRIHPHDRGPVVAKLKKHLASQERLFSHTYRLQRGDGSFAHVLDSGWIVRDAEQSAMRIIGSLTDVTQLKESEAAHRQMSHSLLHAQEQERQRVSRELHDGVNQLLGSAKYRLNFLAPPMASQHPDWAGELDKVRGLLDKAIGEVRAICHNLRPHELDDLGLVAAIESLAREFEEEGQMRVDFQVLEKAGPLPPSVELALYRIVQEALANTEKHARATSVKLFLLHSPNSLWLTIDDNGIGFDPRAAPPAPDSGQGLRNMRERAAALGGSVLVRSKPGRGTSIYVYFPLSPG